MRAEKKFAFDVSATFLSSAIHLFIWFIITLLIGRHLGIDELGSYQMIYTINTIVILIAAIGIPSALIKYAAEYKTDKHKLSQLASAAIITSLIIGCLCSIVFYCTSLHLANIFGMPSLEYLLKIVSPFFAFNLAVQTIFGLLNGLRKMKKFALATILQNILLIAITIPLVFVFNLGVSGAAIGIVLSSLGTLLFLIIISKRYFTFTLKKYVQTTKQLVVFGVKIFIGAAINLINYQADIILIGYFLTAIDVGYYAIAIALSKFFWLIPQSIQKITYPATSEYWSKNNHKALQKMIDKSMKYSACIMLPIGLATGFFAKEIISLTYGHEFNYAVLPLQILIFGTVINGAITRAVGGTLSGIGRADLPPKVSAFAATVNIVLNIALIPRFGINGAAVATAISLIIMTSLSLMLIVKNTGVTFDLPWYGKLAAIILIELMIYRFLPTSYYINIILIFVTIIIIWFYFMRKDDRSYFFMLVKDLKSYFSKGF